MPKDSAASSGPLRPAGSGPAARLAAEGQANDPRARHVGSSAAGLPAGIIALAITGGALLVGGGTMLILAKRDADSYAAHDIQTRADARSALPLRSAAETKGTLGIALLSGSGAALLWVLLFQALDSDDDTDTPDRAMTPRHAARVLPWVSGRGAGLLARAEF